MALVTCPFCKEKFNREKEEFVQIASRRYAHPHCYQKSIEDAEKNAQDYHTLTLLIRNLFKLERLTPLIEKQIKDLYEKNNYSYMGIVKSLIYFYQVQGNSTDKSNGGIGIVPYVYDKAMSYFDELEKIKQNNKDKIFTNEKETVVIPVPTVRKRSRNLPFAFLMEEDNNGETE